MGLPYAVCLPRGSAQGDAEVSVASSLSKGGKHTKMNNEVDFKGIDEVKCPYCGNPVNWKHFSHWSGEQACFIAGCWSGSTILETPEHVFKIWVEVDKEVNVKQKGENQQ